MQQQLLQKEQKRVLDRHNSGNEHLVLSWLGTWFSGVCETIFFHIETETWQVEPEIFGCWYQESRPRLKLFTMVLNIESETFNFGLRLRPRLLVDGIKV